MYIHACIYVYCFVSKRTVLWVECRWLHLEASLVIYTCLSLRVPGKKDSNKKQKAKRVYGFISNWLHCPWYAIAFPLKKKTPYRCLISPCTHTHAYTRTVRWFLIGRPWVQKACGPLLWERESKMGVDKSNPEQIRNVLAGRNEASWTFCFFCDLTCAAACARL